jgi:lactate dehydrogenase-like 2-hydroxyacid dehydrogenase
MGKPKLVIVHPMVARLYGHMADDFELLHYWKTDDAVQFLRQNSHGARAILSLGIEPIGTQVLNELPDLELIAVVGAGYDGIDVAAAGRRGIAITNAGSLHAADNADYAVGLMIAARRRIVAADDWVRTNRWPGEGRMPLGRSLRPGRAGIVGLGNIGKEIATRLGAFGIELGWWGPRQHPSPYRYFDGLRALARWSDTLFVSARADDSSRGLIDAEIIDALGPDGLLINISRGFVVDQQGLADALRSGRLGQAAIDVFDPEPSEAAFWADVPNILLSPHAAGATEEGSARLGSAAIETVRRLYRGEPLENIVLAFPSAEERPH